MDSTEKHKQIFVFSHTLPLESWQKQTAWLQQSLDILYSESFQNRLVSVNKTQSNLFSKLQGFAVLKPNPSQCDVF